MRWLPGVASERLLAGNGAQMALWVPSCPASRCPEQLNN